MGNKIACPQCKTGIDDTEPTSPLVSCRACGGIFARGITKTPPQVIQKVVKCPHCDGLLIIKIPVVFEIKENEITKKKAVACPRCKGNKPLEGAECDTCNGLGAIPASPPKDKKA